MSFLREFVECLDAYCDARSTLDSLTSDDATMVLPSETRVICDELEHRTVSTGTAREARRQYISAKSQLWTLLTKYGFSKKADARLPELSPLGINDQHHDPFLKILDWLYFPDDLQAEIEGPMLRFADLATSVGYQTTAARRFSQRMAQMVEQEPDEHIEATEQSTARETTTYILDLQFDHDGKRIRRSATGEFFSLKNRTFVVVFSIASYLTANPTSSLCPTGELYESIWGGTWAPPGSTRTGQSNHLHTTIKLARRTLPAELGIEITNVHGQGYSLRDTTTSS